MTLHPAGAGRKYGFRFGVWTARSASGAGYNASTGARARAAVEQVLALALH